MPSYLESPPLALAHRGGCALPANVGLENTLTAFRNAVDLGCRYLETDVHATRDGHLVAFHDDRLDRVTDVQGAIADLTLEEVRRARVGADGCIPTLDEVLAAFPSTGINIDIKAPAVTVTLWETIQAQDAFDRVCVGSFSNRRLWHFRRLSRGRVVTAAGRLGTVGLRLLPWRVARWVHTPGQVFQVPLAVDLGPLQLTVVTPEFIRRAHRLGKQVHVWTIDDPAEMERLLAMGVNGLVTDRPDLLGDVLHTRGAWPDPVDDPR